MSRYVCRWLVGNSFDVCWGAPGEGREFRSVIRKILLPVPSWGASYEGKETMFPEGVLGTQFRGGPGESHVPGSLSGNMISRCVWGGLLGLPRGSRRGRFRCSQLPLGEHLEKGGLPYCRRLAGNMISRGVGGKHVPRQLSGNMIPRGVRGDAFWDSPRSRLGHSAHSASVPRL